MTEEYLMTGSFGLDVDAWQGDFYDEDLPSDWRVASYSILLRSVMLPEPEWQKAMEGDWVGEVDEEFRFIVHTEANNEIDITGLIKKIKALPEDFAAQLAGVVLRIQPELAVNIKESVFKSLSEMFPICLDVGKEPYARSGMDAYCEHAGLAAVWYPSTQAEPMPGGEFLITMIDQETLPEQKKIVSKI